tara:strand:+ start:13561 stop:14412 length:852 start_codon:yes stop_codon:yes gene_type:complete
MERNKISLLFGGSGFIGSNISNFFLSNSIRHKVIGKKECDLTKKAELSRLLDSFKDYELDILFTSSIVRKKEDTINSQISNTLMVQNLTELIHDLEIRSFIFFSSIDVYHQDTKEFNETSPTKNNSPYAISKLESEKILNEALADKLTILRMPGVYGPNDNFNSVVGHLVRIITNKQIVKVTNNGMQTRDYLYVDDISRAVLSLLEKPCSGIFNLSSGNSIKLSEIIGIIANKLKVNPELEEIESDSKLNFINISNKKFLKNFPEFQFTSIDRGICKYIETLN